MTTTPQLAFIGGGNMASALIGGLVTKGFTAQQIIASDVMTETLERLKTVAPVRTTTDNEVAIANADVVVLAVKPQVMKQVLEPLAASLQKRRPLIISIAAGNCDQLY